MYTVGVISDTHGLLRPEVAAALGGCQAILHGGDISSPDILQALQEIAPTYAVRGNNDREWAADLPLTWTAELYGVRFFMVHDKKNIPKDVNGTDIVIYGHSHKYEEKYAGGRLLLNPGSCGPRRFTQPVTFALLAIGEDHSFQVEKREIVPQSKRVLKDRMGRRGMKNLVAAVMRDTDKKLPVDKIAAKNGISRELAEQICRLYLTHPGVSADGILGKMGL